MSEWETRLRPFIDKMLDYGGPVHSFRRGLEKLVMDIALDEMAKEPIPREDVEREIRRELVEADIPTNRALKRLYRRLFGGES